MSIDRANNPKYGECLERATKWIIGMQSKNGGWGSFDADNTHYWLNHIPFADHGALLDPPTAEMSRRAVLECWPSWATAPIVILSAGE